MLLEKTIKVRDRWHRYQAKLFGNFNIKDGDNVLDVGCGYPSDVFPLATHCIDPYVKKATMQESSLMDGKLFWPAGLLNVSDWPTGKFHFMYISHVLEHLPDPDKACREIIRLGKRGYIEAPSRVSELLFGDMDHKWFIENREGVLTFIKMTDKERSHPFGDFFYRLCNPNIEQPQTTLEQIICRFYKIKEANPEMFFTMFQWEGSFEWKVIE